MESFKTLKGSCGCGKVTYQIKDKPLITQACHCKDCKKSTGSSFVIHTMVFEDDFSVDGNVSSTELPTGKWKRNESLLLCKLWCLRLLSI